MNEIPTPANNSVVGVGGPPFPEGASGTIKKKAKDSAKTVKNMFKSHNRKESNKIFHQIDTNQNRSACKDEIAAFVAQNAELWAMLSVNLGLEEDHCQHIATRVAMELASGLQGPAALEAEITKDQFHAFRKKYILEPHGHQEFFHRAVFATFDTDNNSVLDEEELDQFLDTFYKSGSIFSGDVRLPPKDKLQQIILAKFGDTDQSHTLPFEVVRRIISGEVSSSDLVVVEDDDDDDNSQKKDAVESEGGGKQDIEMGDDDDPAAEDHKAVPDPRETPDNQSDSPATTSTTEATMKAENRQDKEEEGEEESTEEETDEPESDIRVDVAVVSNDTKAEELGTNIDDDDDDEAAADQDEAQNDKLEGEVEAAGTDADPAPLLSKDEDGLMKDASDVTEADATTAPDDEDSPDSAEGPSTPVDETEHDKEENSTWDTKAEEGEPTLVEMENPPAANAKEEPHIAEPETETQQQQKLEKTATDEDAEQGEGTTADNKKQEHHCQRMWRGRILSSSNNNKKEKRRQHTTESWNRRIQTRGDQQQLTRK